MLADAEGAGCGAPGAEVFLWSQVQNQRMFTRDSLPWPAHKGTAHFDASFSAPTPAGGVPALAEFFGEVYGKGAERTPPGTRVEAYVGNLRCGVASTWRTGSFSGYILSTVGPDSAAGCGRGATLTFRIDGKPATQTAVNDPNRAGPPASIRSDVAVRPGLLLAFGQRFAGRAYETAMLLKARANPLAAVECCERCC